MSWLKTIQWTSCAFGTAAAVALAVPLQTWAQAPANGGTTASQPAGDTAVQRELRRLYEESGREMPEVSRSIQAQRPAVQQPAAQQPAIQQSPMPQPVQGQPAVVQQPVMAPTGQQITQASAGNEAPTPSRPKSGNPVTSFFKRIIPGGSKPTTAAAAPVPLSRPVVIPQQPNTAARPGTTNYAPYSGQQPRRLTPAEVAQSGVPAAPPAALPPSPNHYAPATVAAPQPAIPAAPAAPVANVPQQVARPATVQPVDDFSPFEVPETREVSTAPQPVVMQSPRPQRVPEPEPEFAPPVILEKDSVPELLAPAPPAQTVQQKAIPAQTVAAPQVQEVVAAPVASQTQELASSAAPQEMAAADRAEFPDPFPEMSEEEADDEMDVEDSSPFAGLALEEEPDFGTPASIGTPETVATTPEDETDPFADTPALPQVAEQTSRPAANNDKVTAQVVTTPMPQESKALPKTDEGFPALGPAVETENPLVAKLAPLSQEPAAAQEPAVITKSNEGFPALEVPAAQPPLEVPPASIPPKEEVATTKPASAAPGLTPAVVAKPISHQPLNETDAKMTLIRERGAMKGLKGFCPVSLRDDRELRDAHSEFQAVFRGQKFHFANKAAQEKFEADGSRYVPAAYGADVVVLVRDKDVAEGTLDYAAWYKGKLYLFSSAANHDVFVNDPAQYSAPAGLE